MLSGRRYILNNRCETHSRRGSCNEVTGTHGTEKQKLAELSEYLWGPTNHHSSCPPTLLGVFWTNRMVTSRLSLKGKERCNPSLGRKLDRGLPNQGAGESCGLSLPPSDKRKGRDSLRGNHIMVFHPKENLSQAAFEKSVRFIADSRAIFTRVQNDPRNRPGPRT